MCLKGTRGQQSWVPALTGGSATEALTKVACENGALPSGRRRLLWKQVGPVDAVADDRCCFEPRAEGVGLALARAPDDRSNVGTCLTTITAEPDLGQAMLFVWSEAACMPLERKKAGSFECFLAVHRRSRTAKALVAVAVVNSGLWMRYDPNGCLVTSREVGELRSRRSSGGLPRGLG